jgi:hypothetical protein
LTATEWDQVYEIVSKRLNNLPDVAGAYWWVTQSLKWDMSFTTSCRSPDIYIREQPQCAACLHGIGGPRTSGTALADIHDGSMLGQREHELLRAYTCNESCCQLHQSYSPSAQAAAAVDAQIHV